MADTERMDRDLVWTTVMTCAGWGPIDEEDETWLFGQGLRHRRRTAAGGEPDADWSEFARSQRVKTQRLAEHEVIFYEGDPADRVYELIERGDALQAAARRSPSGGRVVSPEALFGIVGGKLYDCNAETLTPSVIHILDRRDLEGSNRFQGHVADCLRRQIERLHDHAVLLGRKSAFERVATFLMRFVPSRGVPGCHGPQAKDEQVIELTMTRQGDRRLSRPHHRDGEPRHLRSQASRPRRHREAGPPAPHRRLRHLSADRHALSADARTDEDARPPAGFFIASRPRARRGRPGGSPDRTRTSAVAATPPPPS